MRVILLESQRAQKVYLLTSVLARALMLVKGLSLTPVETGAIINNPQAFNVESTGALTLTDIQSLSLYKNLDKQFNDVNNLFITYLQMPDAGCPSEKIITLLTLTGWEVNQICTLINLFWPPAAGNTEYDYNTVIGVARLNRCFQIGLQMGVDIYFLLKLCSLSETVTAGKARGGSANSITLADAASQTNEAYVGLQASIISGTGNGQTRVITSYAGATRVATVDVNWTIAPDNTSRYEVTGLPLANTSNQLIPANWDRYVQLARSTLDALNAKYDNPEFKEVFKSITSQLDTMERDALLGYTIWYLNNAQNLKFIQTPSDLYQFLLIDVEMSGCASTSTIAQGIASVQLYMQRCGIES